MQALAAFPTSILSAEAICHFVGVNGCGEPAAAWVAQQQLELITTAQLRLCGVSRDVVRARMGQDTMHRVHVGVYHLGTRVMLPHAAELAAVMAGGARAFVRRRSAGAMFAIAAPWAGDPEILVVGRNCRVAGIDVARVAVLDPLDWGTKDGIPITSPALTLLDLAAVATGDELEHAISEAYARRLVKEPELRAVLVRHPNRAGVTALRAELDRAGGPVWTASKAERVMKELIRKAGLPMPRTRVRVEGFVADFFWPELRLIVEVDGYQYHGHRYAFDRDHKRDQAHKAALYEVIRFTWRDLQDEPYRVVAVIAVAVGARRQQLAARAV
jgi:very-short-patch-repair endonuclease